MTLVDQQWKFLQHVAALIDFAATKGMVLTGDELERSEVEAYINSCPAGSSLTITSPTGESFHFAEAVGGKGIAKSLHRQRLAIDLNLIIDGALARTVDDYRPLGEYWESLDPQNRWGGKFVHPRPDADHFERQPL